MAPKTEGLEGVPTSRSEVKFTKTDEPVKFTSTHPKADLDSVFLDQFLVHAL
jgi:hypothetical protein